MATKSERDDVEKRIDAEIQMEAFLVLLEKLYGLKSEDIPSILDDMRWVRQHRSNIGRISWSVALGILSIAVAGMMTAMWEGIRSMAK